MQHAVLVQIERVLLSMSSRRGAAPSREQEMLHYQWFADMGYVDAQRAVGRLLSQGGAELAEKALRYFRSHPHLCPATCPRRPARAPEPLPFTCLLTAMRLVGRQCTDETATSSHAGGSGKRRRRRMRTQWRTWATCTLMASG